MIKHEKISINISYRNITHYLKIGYNAILHRNLEIKTEHLPSGSHIVIDVICELCKKENKLRFHKYLENKKRLGFYGCKKCSRQKAAITSLEKYGVDNYSKTDEFKKRVEDTNIKKFGYKTNLISPEYKELIKEVLKEKYGTEKWYEIRNTHNKKNKFILKEDIESLKKMIKLSEELYKEDYGNNNLKLYRNECRRITYRNIKKLYKEWDGIDYYDGIYILDNFKLEFNDPNYPTIDHKISVLYGFLNDIPVEEISKIENLCITKRSINSKKRDLTEEQFKKPTS
jgi:hypothetical protein